jgi:predicted small lipoprotein YifL
MRWSITLPVVVAMSITLAGCGRDGAREPSSPVPDNVVTADIQTGIEKHIEEQSRLGGGYFKLAFAKKQLKLKLVRVHVEYLANLGPRRHFACVDLADTDGQMYDVDFFLAGDPGAMTVTETTVHKTNGQPHYVWEQKPDKTWVRAPAENAAPHLLGVITGRDEFEFLYRARLPQITGAARMWLPLPGSDSYQEIKIKSIKVPGKRSTLQDAEHGNKVLFLELTPADSSKTVELRFHVKRLEKKVHVARDSDSDLKKYLRAARKVPLNDEFRKIALRALKGKKGELVRARALYDHVIDRMRYIKHGKGWGQGDAVFACNARTGNCTDFHSYFIALARSAGIPARFAIGAAIPSARDEGGVDGYHCWAEFYAEGKWWPVDISEADKCSSLGGYYFGHHPANRIELSRGRDLVLTPGPASGPINFLAYPVLEIEGKLVRLKPTFSFKRTAREN